MGHRCRRCRLDSVEVTISGRLLDACREELKVRLESTEYMGSGKIQDVIRDIIKERLSGLLQRQPR